MFTAGSTAVANLPGVARILLIVFCGQLMVDWITVEAKESRIYQSKEGRDSSSGYQEFTLSSKIYRLINETLPWEDSVTRCQSMNFTLAEPSDEDAPGLREYIVNNFGNYQSWVGARGNEEDEDEFVFQKSQRKLSNTSSLIDDKNCRPSITCCIELDALSVEMALAFSKPYDCIKCSYEHYPLCEQEISECQKLGGEIFHGKCYFFSQTDDKKTHEEAKHACSDRKGELAVFSRNPQDGIDIVKERNTGDPRYWVGAWDSSGDGTGWKWDNNVPINWPEGEDPWGQGEPNGVGHDRCLDILTVDDGEDHHGYNDENCNSTHQYICELGCTFGKTVYPPGIFIDEGCAQLQCNGETGMFDNLGYDEQCPSCMAYWDPHILTYDHSCNLVESDISGGRCWSQSYAYQKCGNYSLTQLGNSTNPPIAVSVTFVECQGWSSYTCVDAVTFKNDRNTVVNVVFKNHTLKMTANGEEVNFDALSSSPSVVKVNDIEYPILVWTSNYYNNDEPTSCMSLQGSSGILVRYCGISYNTANTVGVWASEDISHRLLGLCGNANGDPDDDFTTRDKTKTWNFTRTAPVEFPLSWLADSDNTQGICSVSGSRKQPKINCETNKTLPVIFQNQCQDAVGNGFPDANANLSQVLIDDCVYDLCRVTDAEKWMGTVHGSMPIHAEIKEKTAGHCKHKMTHMCKTHRGHCILKTETCNGTIIEKGCHGRKCQCCAPSGCQSSPKCEKKNGKCLLLKDAMSCDGIVNSELCTGNKCACCYPKAPGKCENSEKCSKVNGQCISKWNWDKCDGKLEKKWCKGKKCGCCYHQ